MKYLIDHNVEINEKIYTIVEIRNVSYDRNLKRKVFYKLDPDDFVISIDDEGTLTIDQEEDETIPSDISDSTNVQSGNREDTIL